MLVYLLILLNDLLGVLSMQSLIKFQIFMFTLLFIIIGSIGYWYQISTLEKVQVMIKDKQRITTGSKSKYIVFTTKETYEDTDSFYHQKYNSSDIFSNLKIGCSYEVNVYGKRIPFFSMHRNIVEILKEDTCP